MHGLINRAIECFVRDTYSAQHWDDIVRQAGLEFSEFEPMLNYDESVTKDILGAISTVLNRPVAEILEDIGTYLVSHPNVEALRRLLRFGGVDFVEFLHSLVDLPDRARLAVSDLELPFIELREHSTDRFTLCCQSETEGYGFVLLGILRVMADDYGALVLLEHQGRSLMTESISISLIENSFAEGRSFELGASSA